MIKFSVIIPVRKINEFLKENISYLKQLAYENFEAIIITDEEEKFDFGDDRFLLISSGPIGPGEKRNLGASKATGEVLAFLDDDAYPRSDWLDKAAELFSDPQVYAVGGPAVTPVNAKFMEKMSGRVLESPLASAGTIYRHIPGKRVEIDDYPTVNLLVRKVDFDRVGGFSKEFWPGEDTKFCLDLVKSKGRKFIYDPSLVVFHHRRSLFIPHLKQISRYGRHRGQFARLFPETSRLPAYFAPSSFLLGLLAGPVFCLFWPFLWQLYLGALLFYLILLIWEGHKIYEKDWSMSGAFYVMAGIFLTHIVYGSNFIVGILKKPKLKLRGVDKSTGNYLGG
ncbi:MAG: hypothetical protein KatS3mg101_0321 [Patescibacteria group bacterium]|nr:MAG: hypothetical protein KatS3mg101_0321 [Patescibacteria group bacterium]